MKKILLNTAYFPPIQYLSKIKDYEEVIIEQYEHYGKQSYRNRCDIMTANGVMTLSVPVIKATSKKILTKETCIDYSTSWQKLHFKGIDRLQKFSLLRLLHGPFHLFFYKKREIPARSEHEDNTRNSRYPIFK